MDRWWTRLQYMNTLNVRDTMELLDESKYLVWNDKAGRLLLFDGNAVLWFKENLIPSIEVRCLIFGIQLSTERNFLGNNCWGLRRNKRAGSRYESKFGVNSQDQVGDKLSL